MTSKAELKRMAAENRKKLAKEHLEKTDSFIAGIMGVAPQAKTESDSRDSGSVAGPLPAAKMQPVAESLPVAKQLRVAERSPVAKRLPQPVAKTSPVAKRLRSETATGYAIEAYSTMGSFAHLGMLLVLWDLLPEGEGWLRLGTLAKSMGVPRSTLQRRLAPLESFGYVQILEKGQNGTRIRLATRSENATPRFCSSFLGSKNLDSQETTTTTGRSQTATGSKDTTRSETATGDVETTRSQIAPAAKPLRVFGTKTIERLNRKKLFFVALAAKRRPEELSPQATRLFSELTQNHGEEWTIAFFLAFLPKAAKSPEGYLYKTLENGGEPNPVHEEKARQVLAAIEQIFLKIGEEVLPADWIRAAKIFWIDATAKNCKERQAGLLERLEEFAKMRREN